MKTSIDKDRLISCRQKLGLTQTEAAQLIGVTQPAYQRYEAGSRSPSVQVVREIANVYNTSVDYLTGRSDHQKPDFIIISRTNSPLLYSVVEACRESSDEQLKRLLTYISSLKQ